MTDPATPEGTPVAPAPYRIGEVRLPAGVTLNELAERLLGLPDDVAGLPRRQVMVGADNVTVVYAIDEGVPTPRFGMVVVLAVTPAVDAAAVVLELEAKRWGDPTGHDLTAEGAGRGVEPAFREFSRAFAPGEFLLPYRPVYFLIWYRAGEEYAVTVIGDAPDVREGLARGVVAALNG